MGDVSGRGCPSDNKYKQLALGGAMTKARGEEVTKGLDKERERCEAGGRDMGRRVKRQR